MKIYLGADHRGFKLKEVLQQFLSHKGYEIVDFGTYSEEPVDYPDFSLPVAKKVARDKNSRGIVICGSGQGTAIVANKIKGIRAAATWNVKSAKETRQDNDSNVLSLPSDFIDDNLAKKIVSTWLKTSFSGKERHKRRIAKIKQIEKNA